MNIKDTIKDKFVRELTINRNVCLLNNKNKELNRDRKINKNVRKRKNNLNVRKRSIRTFNIYLLVRDTLNNV